MKILWFILFLKVLFEMRGFQRFPDNSSLTNHMVYIYIGVELAARLWQTNIILGYHIDYWVLCKFNHTSLLLRWFLVENIPSQTYFTAFNDLEKDFKKFYLCVFCWATKIWPAFFCCWAAAECYKRPSLTLSALSS